jgi:hypothetical protein
MKAVNYEDIIMKRGMDIFAEEDDGSTLSWRRT